MSERSTRRFRLGRKRRDATEEDEQPCAPCAQAAAQRPFALDLTTAESLRDDEVPVLSPGFAHVIAGSEVVLFDRSRSMSTLLNSSAALVWASIDGTSTIGTIVDELAEETGADRGVIDRDVRETLARFVAGGLVAPELGQPPSSDDGGDTDADEPTAPTGEVGDEDEVAAAARGERRARWLDAALDRVAWLPGPGPRRASGIAVEVRTDDEDVAARLARHLEPLEPAADADVTLSILRRGRPGSPRRYRVLRGHETRGFAPTPVAAIDLCFTELNDLALGRAAGRIVMHAGAVARDGAAVVIAGPSGRGKSTLTAALSRRGFRYLTDEVAAVDPADRSVLPYAKPIDLDGAGLRMLGVDATTAGERKGKVDLDALGAAPAGSARATLALLVVLEDPTGEIAPPSTPGELLVAMLGNTFASTFADDGPPDPLVALGGLLDAVPVLSLPRIDLDEACDRVVAALAR